MTAQSGPEDVPDTELGRHLDDRRNDLDMTWDDIASLSGLSRQTLYDIRKGNTDYRRMRSSTKRKIEKALQLERGSIDAAILHGQRPAAAPSVDPLRAHPDPNAVPDNWSEAKEQLWLVARATLDALKLKANLTRQEWLDMSERYGQLDAADRAKNADDSR